MAITPSDSPSSPSGYAGVPVSGFDIQAPLGEGAIQAAFDATTREMGPGSPRQMAAEHLLQSPPGYSDFTILGGTTAGWPADVTP